ncbi:Ig-like domain repeat protein, partial [Acinetobacter baumannii]
MTFTASVASAAGSPSGSVTFKNGGTAIGSGTLSGGVASFTTSSLAK